MFVEDLLIGDGFAAMSRTRGVWGRDGAFSPSWLSRSARMSCSTASALALAVLDLGAGFLPALSSPMPSNRSPSSSSVGAALARLVVMVGGRGDLGAAVLDVIEGRGSRRFRGRMATPL